MKKIRKPHVRHAKARPPFLKQSFTKDRNYRNYQLYVLLDLL